MEDPPEFFGDILAKMSNFPIVLIISLKCLEIWFFWVFFSDLNQFCNYLNKFWHGSRIYRKGVGINARRRQNYVRVSGSTQVSELCHISPKKFRKISDSPKILFFSAKQALSEISPLAPPIVFNAGSYAKRKVR